MIKGDETSSMPRILIFVFSLGGGGRKRFKKEV